MEEIKMKNLYLLFLILAVLVSIKVYSQVSLDIIGHFGGEVHCGTVSGDYAFLGQGKYITVLDISGAEPQQVASFHLNREAVDIIVSGEYAYIYVNHPDSGLLIVNVADPLNITAEGSCLLSGDYAGSVFVEDGYAYVAALENGFYIVDINDPAQPFVVGNYTDTDEVYDVYVDGTLACLADRGDDLIRLVDVSDPANPYETGNCAGDLPVSVYVQDDYAYIAEAPWELLPQKGMRVVDISDPSNPVSVAYFETKVNSIGFPAYEICVEGDYAYLTTQRMLGGQLVRWFFIADISDPLNPFEAGKVEYNGNSFSLQVSSPKAYITTNSAMAFETLDISDPSNPVVKTSFKCPGSIAQILMRDNYLFVSSYEGLFVYETVEEGLPELLVSYPGWQAYNNMYLYQDVICAVFEFDLFTIDVSDIYNIQELASDISLDGRGNGLAGYGSYVYTPVGNMLKVVNISNPMVPVIENEMELMGMGKQLFIDGPEGLLYTTFGLTDTDQGFQILDIFDPANITSLGLAECSGDPKCIFVNGDMAYVGSNSASSWSLQSYDVSNPSNPVLQEETGDEGYITHITGNDTVLYAGVIGQSIYAINILTLDIKIKLETDGTVEVLVNGNMLYSSEGMIGDYGGDYGKYGALATIAGSQAEISTISLDPAYHQCKVGENKTFHALGWDEHGNPVEIGNPEWSADGGEIDPTGSSCEYTATETGTFTLNCKESGTNISGSATIEVTAGMEVKLENNGYLIIIINDDRMCQIAVDDDGHVIVNNEKIIDELSGTFVNAIDVYKLTVKDKGPGDNTISLEYVDSESFPNIPDAYTQPEIAINVICGSGNETVDCSDLGTEVEGYNGNDVIHAGRGIDRIFGGNGNDKIFGHSYSERMGYLYGESGDDIIYKGEGNYINSGSGNDKVKSLFDYDHSIINTFPFIIIDTLADISGHDTLDYSQDNLSHTINLDLLNTGQVIYKNGNGVCLIGQYECFIGSVFDDIITVKPLQDQSRYIDGGGSRAGDTLYFNALGYTVNNTGSEISVPGYEPVYYKNFSKVVLYNYSGINDITSSDEIFNLEQNLPNPFSKQTEIKFTIIKDCMVTLKVYDLKGEEIGTLTNKQYSHGDYSLQFDAIGLECGIYLFLMEVKSRSGIFWSYRKGVLIKN